MKSIAAVLLRRIFLQLEYKDIVEDIESGVLGASKAELLLAMQSETSGHVRRKICDAIAEMARSYLGECRVCIWSGRVWKCVYGVGVCTVHLWDC